MRSEGCCVPINIFWREICTPSQFAPFRLPRSATGNAVSLGFTYYYTFYVCMYITHTTYAIRYVLSILQYIVVEQIKSSKMSCRLVVFLITTLPGLTALQIAPVFKPVAISRSNVVVATVLEPSQMDERIYNFNKVVIDSVYEIICLLYPVTGGSRDFARFYVLETVARVPYFAYLSVMHLRETFGDRSPGSSERMRTHYAEADNELHHLLIMESLGGNSSVIDRTIAQTMAFFYYWYVVGVYSLSEQAACMKLLFEPQR